LDVLAVSVVAVISQLDVLALVRFVSSQLDVLAVWVVVVISQLDVGLPHASVEPPKLTTAVAATATAVVMTRRKVLEEVMGIPFLRRWISLPTGTRLGCNDGEPRHSRGLTG
jgi:hypothetical protein